MSEIMKIIDERETQNRQRQKGTTGDRNCRERVTAKWLFCVFKSGYFRLIRKAFLIFKSNLELALSIILKQRELYESKHLAVEWRCCYETCYPFSFAP